MQSVVGEIYEGKVTGITAFGAFVKMSNGETGMVHISEVACVYVKDINEVLSEGQEVKVKVLAINENNKISLSIKQALPQEARNNQRPNDRNRQGSSSRKANSQRGSAQSGSKSANQSAGPMSFEDMMAKFKQESDEKMSVLKRSGDFKTGTRRGYGNK